MTFGVRLRKALIVAPFIALAGCGGGMEADQGRFESLARMVAAVDVPARGERSARLPAVTSADAGLRPAVRVEVMDPHDLWDARDAGLRGVVEAAGPAVVEAAAPALQAAAVGAVQRTTDQAIRRVAVASETTIIQLGAFSSEAAARVAWSQVSTGAAARIAGGLEPSFTTVDVNGRTFTRLRVRAPAEQAAALCRLADVADPWCRSAA